MNGQPTAHGASADKYAVIGFPIAHSWSPFIHGLFAKQTGHTLTYSRLEVAPEALTDRVVEFFATGGKGLNVTLPHKQAACLLARERTPRAEMAGAFPARACSAITDGSGTEFIRSPPGPHPSRPRT